MKLTRKLLIRIAIAVTLNSLSMLALSQDLLLLRNGTSMAVKVLEVTPTEIKFKRTENIDGPLYTELKTNIRQIRYENGLVETFSDTPLPDLSIRRYERPPGIGRTGKRYYIGDEPASEYDMQEKLLDKNDEALDQHVHQARIYRGLQNIGWVGIPLIAIANYDLLGDLYSGGYGNMSPNRAYREKILAGSAVLCLAGSISFKILRVHHNDAALRRYEQLNN